jgi:hypothetical protein
MKTTKILYRVSTILLALFILPGFFYLNSEMAKQGMLHIGAPAWLGHLVGYGQPLGILLILIPMVWHRLKERAYVALGIIYLGALYAHLIIDWICSDVIFSTCYFWIVVNFICLLA